MALIVWCRVVQQRELDAGAAVLGRQPEASEICSVGNCSNDCGLRTEGTVGAVWGKFVFVGLVSDTARDVCFSHPPSRARCIRMEREVIVVVDGWWCGGRLWQRLVDKLEDNTHLPTVLQSLGCIAQNAMPIFETREDDIIKFVVRNVLRRPSPPQVGGSI